MIKDKNVIWKQVEPVTLPGVDDIHPVDLKRVMLENPETFKAAKQAAEPSTNFWRTHPLGRTLSGRNKAGRFVRKIGIAAASVGGALVGVDVGGLIDTGQDAAQLEQILNTLETIAWIVAGIVGTLAGGTDYIEIKGVKYDEQEILEGKVPGMRKLKQKLKGEAK